MNTQNWNKMSERQPTAADMPVWLNDGPDKLVHLFHGPIPDRWLSLYWKSAIADVPAPPKPETQHDKDSAEMDLWLKRVDGAPSMRRAWHAACDYARKCERAEIGKLLPDVHTAVRESVGGGHGEYVAAVAAIRAHCRS